MRELGSYILFVYDSFTRIENYKIVSKSFFEECIKVGYNSLFIVAIVSIFTGAVSAIQTAYNLEAPYIQDYIIAMVVRDSTFSLIPTLLALIYAGKVGSHIAGELGTMKITEQIDALEVMGLNSRSYLALPKILSSLVMFPMLVILGCALSMIGGFMAITLLNIITTTDYVIGIRADFNEFMITIILIKSIVFGFIVATISSQRGFLVVGGALEVGRASTNAVIRNCIAILACDYILTQVLMN